MRLTGPSRRAGAKYRVAKATAKLKTYRAKRDFSKTQEPSGARKVLPAAHRRFVIQKHAASHLHWDFRLELERRVQVMGVTKGPSVDPADKRLAVEVEDHPLDYGDFEGTIPKGEYGGGTVQMWDRGFWAPQGDQSPRGGARGRRFQIRAGGQATAGSFVLVKIKNNRGRDKRTNWLLIKHRDEYARPGETEELIAEDKSVASGRTMDQIARGVGKAPKAFMVKKAEGEGRGVEVESGDVTAGESFAQGQARRTVGWCSTLIRGCPVSRTREARQRAWIMARTSHSESYPGGDAGLPFSSRLWRLNPSSCSGWSARVNTFCDSTNCPALPRGCDEGRASWPRRSGRASPSASCLRGEITEQVADLLVFRHGVPSRVGALGMAQDGGPQRLPSAAAWPPSRGPARERARHERHGRLRLPRSSRTRRDVGRGLRRVA